MLRTVSIPDAPKQFIKTVHDNSLNIFVGSSILNTVESSVLVGAQRSFILLATLTQESMSHECLTM